MRQGPVAEKENLQGKWPQLRLSGETVVWGGQWEASQSKAIPLQTLRRPQVAFFGGGGDFQRRTSEPLLPSAQQAGWEVPDSLEGAPCPGSLQHLLSLFAPAIPLLSPEGLGGCLSSLDAGSPEGHHLPVLRIGAGSCACCASGRAQRDCRAVLSLGGGFPGNCQGRVDGRTWVERLPQSSLGQQSLSPAPVSLPGPLPGEKGGLPAGGAERRIPLPKADGVSPGDRLPQASGAVPEPLLDTCWAWEAENQPEMLFAAKAANTRLQTGLEAEAPGLGERPHSLPGEGKAVFLLVLPPGNLPPLPPR